MLSRRQLSRLPTLALCITLHVRPKQVVKERTLLADPPGETRGSEGKEGKDVERVEQGSTGLLWGRMADQKDARRLHLCVHRRVSRLSPLSSPGETVH